MFGRRWIDPGRDSELGGCRLRVGLKHRLASLLRCTRGDTGRQDGRFSWLCRFQTIQGPHISDRCRLMIFQGDFVTAWFDGFITSSTRERNPNEKIIPCQWFLSYIIIYYPYCCLNNGYHMLSYVIICYYHIIILSYYP